MRRAAGDESAARRLLPPLPSPMNRSVPMLGFAWLTLRQAQEALIALTGAVREQNRVNDRLIHGCLAYVTQFMNLLRSMFAGAPGYLPTGAIQESSASGRLLALKG